MLLRVVLCLSCAFVVGAFHPPSFQRVRRTVQMNCRRDHLVIDDADAFSTARNACVAVLMSSILAFNLAPVNAAVPDVNKNVNPSSTIIVSEAIKTLDMGLPSYGDVVRPTASVENVEGLANEVTPVPLSSKKKASPKKESSAKGGGLGAVLPSMNKSGPSQSQDTSAEIQRQKEARQAELEAKKAAMAAEKAEAAEKAALERAAVNAERVAAKQAAAAEKATKAAAEQDAPDAAAAAARVEVVDMALPSYSDTTATRGRSVFSIK